MGKRVAVVVVLLAGLFLAWRLTDLYRRQSRFQQCAATLIVSERLHLRTYPDGCDPDPRNVATKAALCELCESLLQDLAAWRLFPWP